MSGLLFFAAVAIWFIVLIWLVNKIGNLLPDQSWRSFAKLIIFVSLLPLPLIDEIVGGWQFAQLCKANVVRIDKETARGRRVYDDLSGYQVPVPGTWVKVWKMTSRYLDATTGELVMSFDQLRAEGGHLFPGFDSGHDPLIFKGTCAPPNVGDMSLYTELGLTLVARPQSK